MKKSLVLFTMFVIANVCLAYNNKVIYSNEKCDDKKYKVIIIYKTINCKYINNFNIQTYETSNVEKIDTVCLSNYDYLSLKDECNDYNANQKRLAIKEFKRKNNDKPASKEKNISNNVDLNSNILKSLEENNKWLVNSYKIPSTISVVVCGATTIGGIITLLVGNNNDNKSAELIGCSLVSSGVVGVSFGTWGLIYSKKLSNKFDTEIKLFTNGLTVNF